MLNKKLSAVALAAMSVIMMTATAAEARGRLADLVNNQQFGNRIAAGVFRASFFPARLLVQSALGEARFQQDGSLVQRTIQLGQRIRNR